MLFARNLSYTKSFLAIVWIASFWNINHIKNTICQIKNETNVGILKD